MAVAFTTHIPAFHHPSNSLRSNRSFHLPLACAARLRVCCRSALELSQRRYSRRRNPTSMAHSRILPALMMNGSGGLDMMAVQS